MIALTSVLSVRGPAPVDRQQGAGDRGCIVGAEEGGEGGDLRDFDELFGRLRRQQYVLHHRFFAGPAGPRLFGNLLLNERRQDMPRADGVGGDAVFRQFKRHSLGQAGEAAMVFW